MQSDKFLFTVPEKALDKIERLAGCYEFGTKEILQIRLLAEEIISVIKPTLKLSSGRFWVTTTEKSFAVTIDCDSSMSTLDRGTRESLLQMSRSEKKGIAGVIEKVMGFLSAPDVDYSVLPNVMICSYCPEMGYYGYRWENEFFNAVPFPMPEPDAEEEHEHDLEISIIEGFADDISVGLKRSKHGVRLEITVIKNFVSGQAAEIEF